MSGIPVWAQAGFWGLVAGGALLIGAATAYFVNVPQRLIAAIMAFGSGVLISALSFELMDEAFAGAASIPRPSAFSAALPCSPRSTGS
jgi:zinc transporter, ZIP family